MSAMWHVWFAEPNMLWPWDFHLPRINLQMPEESWDNNIGFAFFNIPPLQCKIHTHIYIYTYIQNIIKHHTQDPIALVPALLVSGSPLFRPSGRSCLQMCFLLGTRHLFKEKHLGKMWLLRMTVVDDRLGAFQVFQTRCSEVNAHYLWSFWNLYIDLRIWWVSGFLKMWGPQNQRFQY